jgi:hypothetical protein
MASTVADAGAALSAELERLALRALAEDYDDLNYSLFGSRLRRPQLQLSDSVSRLGLWDPKPRVLWIATQLVTGQPWGSVREVLKHEMAHQFVNEVLLSSDESAHGPLFQKVCEERGIDGRASGQPTSAPEDTHVVEKIARLLSLSQSANEHEAQAAMAAAQRLMLKHNIEVSASAAPRQFIFRHLGEATSRVDESQRVLGSILGEFFFVEILWVSVFQPEAGRRGTVLEVCGTPSNVDLAEYVHAFLRQSSQSLWEQHRRENGIRGNADRRRYIAGVMTGFYEKLTAQREPARELGLVWVGDEQLRGYFRKRYPRTRRVSYASSANSSAHREGRRAGEKLVLHKGVTATETRSRLLTR